MPANKQIKYQTFFCDVKTDWTDKMTYLMREIRLLVLKEADLYFQATRFLGIVMGHIEGNF